VAEFRTATLARIKPYLTDFPQLVEKLSDHRFRDFLREPTNPDGATIVWLLRFRWSNVFARAVGSKRLILSIIHAYRHALDQFARHFCSLIHSLSLKEFHVAKVTVSQLVNLQTNHLDLPTRLKQVDYVLLRAIY
jgi:hypothetical protein